VQLREKRSGYRLLEELAVLTFNLVNYGKPGTGEESVVARWNSTEVTFAGKWKIIHSHWSYLKPQVKGP
jgi:hypothetical protein